jgi:hypothetical protein
MVQWNNSLKGKGYRQSVAMRRSLPDTSASFQSIQAKLLRSLWDCKG